MKKQQQPAAAFKELVDRKCTKRNGYVVALFLQGRRTFFPFIPPPLFSFRPSRAGVCVCGCVGELVGRLAGRRYSLMEVFVSDQGESRLS